jgi:hypothetical protein
MNKPRPENEKFLRQFENIVNNIYEKQILPKKRKHPIKEHDIYDLRMIFGLSTTETQVIDYDKLIENMKKYG